MKRERLQSTDRFGAFDVETHLIQPGLLAPPLVCGSYSDKGHKALLDKEDARARLLDIQAGAMTIAGANIAYDLAVMAADGCSVFEIFQLYEEGRVYDVQIAESLHAIAKGHLGLMPDRGPLKDPGTGKVTTRYSLAMVTKLVLGRGDAKEHDRWRLSYALLDGVPLQQWPEEARIYPIDDAVNTLEVAVAQSKTRANLHNLSFQVYAAWAMHLGATWGFKVDLEELASVRTKAEQEQEAGRGAFLDPGIAILKSDKNCKITKNTPRIKELVAKAYGAKDPCTECKGTKRTISVKTGNPINCIACNASGLCLDGTRVPRTETGGVGIGRDVLLESGNEWLMRFADYTQADKVLTTYVPWLEKGEAGPINLRPNVLLASGRASYSDVVQLLPRNMGIRECIVARPGTVFCSCDYAALELVTHAQSIHWLLPDEPNKLMGAINAGVKVHDLLGSQMLGIPYEDFLAKRKAGDKTCNNIRQAAKAANFGFPGGMGPVTFVLAKRKEDFYTGAFKGIRLCLLIGGEESCGEELVTEYKGREYPPVCKKCIECSIELREQWFEAWPENRAYFKFISKQLDVGHIVQHVSGRVRGGVTFTSAANGYFQGLAADGAKNALIKVAYEEYCDPTSALYGCRTILFAHDELIVEMPENRAHEGAMRLQEVMVSAMREYTPDVSVEAEPCLMMRWYKGAEPVFDEGRLVPWTP